MKIGKLGLAAVVATALTLGGLIGFGAGQGVAQTAATRKIVGTVDVAGTEREAALGIASLPDGSAFARHYHPGEEMAVVIEGEVVVKVEGRADQLLQAGQSYVVPRGALHSAAPPPGKSARVVAVWITDKGQPLAVPG